MSRLKTAFALTVAAGIMASLLTGPAEVAIASGPMTGQPGMTSIVPSAAKHKVIGRMKKAYRKVGGLRGVGLPTSKAKCGLPEGGCIQHFKKGTLYLQRSGKVWWTSSKGVRGEMLIVTRSQLWKKQGTSGGLQKTKYSRYTGGGPSRWCNHLHAWVAYASGNTKVIPRIADWDKMKRYMRKHWKHLSKPQRGAYAIMHGSADESHMALVWMVRPGNRITIIEGNWGKQVNMRTIPVTRSMHFYSPYSR